MWWIAIPWAVAAIRPSTRTAKFFVLLLISSGTVLAADAAGPSVAFVVRTAVIVLVGLALAFAEPLRLGALTSQEVRLDDLVRDVVRRLDGARGVEASETVLQKVASDEGLMRAAADDPRWQMVVTLLAAAADPDRTDPPRSDVLLAARHYWHDVRNRKVLGRRSMTGAWDFDLYLHVQLGRIQAAPTGEVREAVVNEVTRSVPLDAEWAHVRDLLVALFDNGETSEAPTAHVGSKDERRARLDEAWRHAQRAYESSRIHADHTTTAE